MASQNYPYSSRLLVHIAIGLGALFCFCFVPKTSHPFTDKESRDEVEAIKAGKRRQREEQPHRDIASNKSVRTIGPAS